VPNISEYQAELIMRGDREALQLAIDEILAQRRSPDPEAEAKAVARAVLAEAINNSRTTFEALDAVVNGLGGLTGRKLVVLVSDGFTSGFGVEGRAAFDLRRITDSGTRSGVIVYALDSRGLRAPVGFSASSRDPMIIQGRSSAVSARDTIALAGDFAARDAMNAMAADSGGFLVTNTNNLSNALQRILRDTAAYYVLAYEPTSTKRDGAFRKIEVRLPELKNVRVRHRKGYFGPGGAGKLASSGASPPAPTSPTDPSQAELRTALTSLEPLGDLPIRLSADFLSTSGGATEVVIHGHVDSRDLPLVETGDKRLATVDFAAAVFDGADAVVASLPVERASLELTLDRDARKRERGALVPAHGPAQARPLSREPRGPGSSPREDGQRDPVGRDSRPQPRSAGAQQPVPDEGGPRSRCVVALRSGRKVLRSGGEPLRAVLRLQPAARRGESRLADRVSGTPDRARTYNLRLRRPTLYPVELRALSVQRLRGEPDSGCRRDAGCGSVPGTPSLATVEPLRTGGL
jgi:hypothetical protein